MKKNVNVMMINHKSKEYKIYVTDHSVTCDTGFPFSIFENSNILNFSSQARYINRHDLATYFKENPILKRYDIEEAKIHRISVKTREEYEDKCSYQAWAEVYEINFELNSVYFRFDSIASGSETEFGGSRVMKIEEITKKEIFMNHVNL
jgi:hypothetical protein